MTSQPMADRVGIWLSSICMVHCLLTPIVLIFMPVVTLASVHGYVHQILAIGLSVMAFLAFIPGYWIHRNKSVLLLGVIGLITILFAAYFPFGELSPIADSMITITGSIFLIAGHVRNRRLQTHANAKPALQCC